MEENYCFQCQEPKTVVGHATESCPKVKCRTCGQKGHTVRNCPHLDPRNDEKSKKLDPFEKMKKSVTAEIVQQPRKKFKNTGLISRLPNSAKKL